MMSRFHFSEKTKSKTEATLHCITAQQPIIESFVISSTSLLPTLSRQTTNNNYTMPSPSSSSSSDRQELLSAVVVAGRTSSNSAVSVSSATNNNATATGTAPTAAASSPVICYYELLRDEPSTKRVLQPRRTRRHEETKSCLAPRQAEVHLLAVASGILREVEQELEEAEASIRQQQEPRDADHQQQE